MRSGIVVALALASLSACKSSTGSSGPAPADSTSPASASASAAPSPSDLASRGPLAIPGATAATLLNMSLPERFAIEAKARPAGIKPTVEDAYAALAAGGFTIVDQRQHLASPLGARYCVGARSVGDGGSDTQLQISVCECSTPDVARMARDYTMTTMSKVIPYRTAYVNRQTMLVLREEKNTPEIDALVARASAVFAKL